MGKLSAKINNALDKVQWLNIKNGLRLMLYSVMILLVANIFEMVSDITDIRAFSWLYRSFEIGGDVLAILGSLACAKSDSPKLKKSSKMCMVVLVCSILAIAIPTAPKFTALISLIAEIGRIFFISNFIKGCGEVTRSPEVRKLSKFTSLSRTSASVLKVVPTVFKFFNVAPVLTVIFAIAVFVIRLLHHIAFGILIVAAYRTVE